MRQGPAKELPTSLFSRHSGMRALADSLEAPFKELTAVSAICLLLGLAIWFSKTEPLVAAATCATVFYFSAAAFQPRVRLLSRRFRCRGGARFYFEARFLLSSTVAASFPSFASLEFRTAPLRSAFLRGGAASTSLPRPLVNRFVRLPASDLTATSPRRGARLLPPPRWESTSLVDFYFVFHCFVRGRGFYRHAARLQPPRLDRPHCTGFPHCSHRCSLPSSIHRTASSPDLPAASTRTAEPWLASCSHHLAR